MAEFKQSPSGAMKSAARPSLALSHAVSAPLMPLRLCLILRQHTGLDVIIRGCEMVWSLTSQQTGKSSSLKVM